MQRAAQSTTPNRYKRKHGTTPRIALAARKELLRTKHLPKNWRLRPTAGHTLHLAVLIPTAEERPEFAGTLGAVSLAVKAANDRFSILNAATRLEVHLRETECDYSKSVATLSMIMEEFPVDGVIGPHCSKACASTADLANGRDVPQISYSCAAAELSDKTRYPTVCSPCICRWHLTAPRVRTVRTVCACSSSEWYRV